MDKATFFHAETHCWQNSTNDKKVQKFTEVMEQICKLTTLRENFENQLKIYCHARHGLEDAIEKIERIIVRLECTLESGNREKIDEVIKRARDVLKDGLYAAEKTARDFNTLC